MKQNKPLKITDYLSVGEENAVNCKQLAKYLGFNERDVTVCINIARKQGEFICSGIILESLDEVRESLEKVFGEGVINTKADWAMMRFENR